MPTHNLPGGARVTVTKQLCLSLFITTAAVADLAAHGGTYRGPGNVVPPPTGGSGSGSSGSSSTSNSTGSRAGSATANAPQPAGPSTPANAAGGATNSSMRGNLVGDDLTRWSFWWEFNKDRFINLRAALAGRPAIDADPLDITMRPADPLAVASRPNRADVLREVLPALRQTLQATADRDVITACLVGIAKLGVDHPDFKILPLLAEHLRSPDQEVRETAALVLGISQLQEALPMLLGLLNDTADGRELTGRTEVDVRTRTFAAYGTGLVANTAASAALKSMAFAALRNVLKTTQDRNLQVGVIQGIRMIKVDAAADSGERALRDAMLDALWSFYTTDLGPGAQQVQAHVPGAIATVLGRGGDTVGTYKPRLLAELRETQGKRSIFLLQSAALALGQLCTPDACDADYVAALMQYSRDGRDQQARYFALIALGGIGGAACRTALLQRLEQGKDQDRSWAALALGVLAHETLERGGRSAAPDTTIGRALLAAVQDEHSPEVLTALAVALGLTRYTDASDALRGLLDKHRRDDERAGYVAIGLALMGDRGCHDLLRGMLTRSTRRPDLIRQVAVAMGKLGVATAATDLAGLLQDPDRNVAKLSAVASALGLIGNRHSIAPLRQLLSDSAITDLSRAFVAAALGSICDKEDLPWNAKIGADVNYRAAVETLTNQVSGILDIL